MKKIIEIKPSNLFWFFSLAFCLIWIIVPDLMRVVTSMDPTEGAMWGVTLQLGYPRDPWLNAWLTRLALVLSGYHDIGIYIIARIFIMMSLWSCWRLSKIILKDEYLALVSVVLIMMIDYYQYGGIGFNDNICLLGLWGLMILYFYRAIETNSLKHWVLVSIFSGLAFMGKYYTIVPLLTFVFFMAINPIAREKFKSWKFYFSIFIALVIVTPHIIWLFYNNFLTIAYSNGKVSTGSVSFLTAHFYYALHFFLAQIIKFIPAFLLLMFLLVGKNKTNLINKKLKSTNFNTQFILLVAMGSYFFTILISIIFGLKLNTNWGVPILIFSGTSLLYFIKPLITVKKLKIFLITFSMFSLLIPLGYSIAIIKSKSSSANMPMRKVAIQADTLWNNLYHKPLKYVAGVNQVASYISRYSKFHPAGFIDFQGNMNPSIDVSEMKKYGALFVLANERYNDGKVDKGFEQKVLHEFPTLKIYPKQEISWEREKTGQKKFVYQFAILPPE